VQSAGKPHGVAVCGQLTIPSPFSAHRSVVIHLERDATPMAFTLGTAAQATGTAKSTVLRAIKAGRISASRDETGQWQIQPVELFRVFPALAIPGATAPSVPALPDATTDGMVKLLQDQLADMRAQIADLRPAPRSRLRSPERRYRGGPARSPR
jgi:hypothetical protein